MRSIFFLPCHYFSYQDRINAQLCNYDKLASRDIMRFLEDDSYALFLHA